MASQHPETEARSSSGAKAAPCHWAKLDAIVMSPENAVPEGVWTVDAVRLCVCVCAYGLGLLRLSLNLPEGC